MKFTLTPKWVIGGACLIGALIVMGIYFGSHWYYGEVEPVSEELLHYTPSPAVSRGTPEVSKGRLSWNADSATGSVSSSSEGAGQAADGMDDLDDLEYTPVYYFPDGTPVPEHLLCPEKWDGVYLYDLGDQEPAELAAHWKKMTDEVIANHNLNRPLAELWPRFIELEREYQAQAIQDNKSGWSIAGGKIDLQYEQYYNFPEILRLSEEDSDRWFNMFMVDKGNYDPDWNLYTLPDEREFRAGDGYMYEFHYRSVGNVDPDGVTEIYERTSRVSHSGRDAQLVVIDLNETSDEELERLGGWNYNYNPYTRK